MSGYNRPMATARHQFLRFIEYCLQPALLVAVIWIWYENQSNPWAYPALILGVQLVLGFTEQFFPAREDWVQHAPERLRNITIVLVVTLGTLSVGNWYASSLAEPLARLRESLGADVWPHHWPVLVQLGMVFLASEFIWYWVHRAEHRWGIVWRLSGHGAHHSFKHLGAINFGANHPFEMFLLVLPAALVELFFGVGVAAAGSAVLTTTQASIAHTNLKMNSRGIGWVLTTNNYHIRHHSTVLEESNTNYGCSAILWDRVFGTFSEGPVVDAGIGPTEPSTWRKLLMPFREPEDSAVAPESVRT